MESFKFGKILVYTENDGSEAKQQRLLQFDDQIREMTDFEVIYTTCLDETLTMFMNNQDIVTIFMEYCPEHKEKVAEVLKKIRHRNKYMPVIAFSTKQGFNTLSDVEFTEFTDFTFLYEDDIEFLVGRLVSHAETYIDKLEAPFLKALIKYVDSYKYPWHTPGHMGGAAFRKNPPGQFFYDFLGPNVFRADLSISVPDLGSLLDHSGPIADSEKYSARVFGADQTYYVLNGTSSVNQIIWKGRVIKDELALVDRNCHKSLNYAMVVSQAIPTYMVPRRNGLGIIGPVHLTEFTAESIKNRVAQNPLVPADKKNNRVKMSALTNSTYDGLCYNVNRIKDSLVNNVDNMHFDEAWYAYARFNPIYREHYAMTEDTPETKEHPPIFASHSTHKLMAAFSQASMLHVKNGTKVKVDPEIFNEAYMMYGSTSPQYNMIASLDVTSSMMDFNGKELINDTIVEAVELRKRIMQIHHQEVEKGGWFFSVWQPTTTTYEGKKVDFADAPTEFLAEDQNTWILKKEDNWHGFADIEDDYVMLDPIKITVKMPGITVDGQLEENGIPAAIVSNFLQNYGVVPEKTDYYSFLLLNSMGTTKGKQNALISGLSHFKKLYDQNAPVTEVFPCLAEYECYAGVGLKDHCQAMHEYIKNTHMLELMSKAFSVIPTPKYSPSDASRMVFQEKVEKVTIDEMKNRIAAVMIVPYPPGIPMMMGGEIIDKKSESIVEYLLARETFEDKFPGYYGDIHGVEVKVIDGKRRFVTLVLKED